MRDKKSNICPAAISLQELGWWEICTGYQICIHILDPHRITSSIAASSHRYRLNKVNVLEMLFLRDKNVQCPAGTRREFFSKIHPSQVSRIDPERRFMKVLICVSWMVFERKFTEVSSINFENPNVPHFVPLSRMVGEVG